MNIRQRIEALKKQVNYDDPDIAPVLDIAHNEAIDDVLKEIDAEFAEKDKPKSEGAYLRFEGRWIATQIYTNNIGDLFYESGNSRDYNLSKFKWISLSAILPKGENDEQAG